MNLKTESSGKLDVDPVSWYLFHSLTSGLARPGLRSSSLFFHSEHSILRIHFFQITIEPPQGLRANLLVAYQSKPINVDNFYCQQEAEASEAAQDEEKKGSGNGTRQTEFQRLIYGLCFFHGVVLERHRYGPAGWNNRYAFNMSDLGISLNQMKEILFKVKFLYIRVFKVIANLFGWVIFR